MLSRRRVWLIGSAALVVIAVLAVVSFVDHSDSPTAAPRSSAPGSAVAGDPLTQARLAAIRRTPDDSLARGSLTAPVVVSEWGDFQCPFCRAFATDTEPTLLHDFVDSGRVRLEWHDLAYLGPESVVASRAARAAGRQGKFWQFHDALYRDQPPENSGMLTQNSMVGIARRLGLDGDRFVADFNDPAIAAAVENDRQYGARLGITRVPSFLINGRFFFGAQPISAFRRAIDDALTRAG